MGIFDPQVIEQARKADVIDFFKWYCGFSFVKQGRGYRCKEHQSLVVSFSRIYWHWFSKNMGGNAIDYLINIEKMMFLDAVMTLSGIAPAAASYECPPKTLMLPEKAAPSCLNEYLCVKRCIDREIVETLIRDGKIYEDSRKNIVFVGFDELGKPGFASLRGTCENIVFRRDCSGSNKKYSFNVSNPNSETLYIFEAALDLCSFGTIVNMMTGDKNAWKRLNMLSLAGVSDISIPQYLKTLPLINVLFFCLDDDDSGNNASMQYIEKYQQMGYFAWRHKPVGKDFNDDLVNMVRQSHPDLLTSCT
jgi:hypothetical protein